MGAFLSYVLQVSLVTAVLFACYKALLSSATFHAFKRVVLLAILAGSWFLPLVVPRPEAAGMERASVSAPATKGEAAEGTVEVGAPVAVAYSEESAPDTAAPAPWMRWLAPVYVAGLVGALLFTLLSVGHLVRMIRRGEKRCREGFTMVLNDHAAGPFSWGRYVVLRRCDCDSDLSLVMTHELSHLRLYHWVDNLLAQLNVALLWFSPFSYLMLREFKSLHEFEADRAVAPEQVRRYQMMLIKKTVGSSFPTFADSLNHSQIKKRITMMMKRKSSSARRLTALALPAAAVFSAFVLSQSAVAQILADVSNSVSAPVSGGKVSQNADDAQIVAAVMEELDASKAYVADGATQEMGEAIASVNPAKEAEISGQAAKLSGKGSPEEEKTSSAPAPAIFVDGKLWEGSLASLDPSKIKSMTVKKDDPQYPQGKILIETGEDGKVALAAEQVASFKGGDGALSRFLVENLKYPKGLAANVRVIVQFTVTENGGVKDINVLRSGGEAADAEAMRVVAMTDNMWTPAMTDGKPVASKFVMPVSFKSK